MTLVVLMLFGKALVWGAVLGGVYTFGKLRGRDEGCQ